MLIQLPIQKMGAEFYLLKPGTYTYELSANNKKIIANTFTAEGPRITIQFTLPKGTVCHLEIQPKK